MSDLHLSARPNVRGLLDAKRFSIGFKILCRSLAAFHCAPGVGTYSSRDVRALSATLREREEAEPSYYDIYLFTGDLATTGEQSDLLVARRFLEGIHHFGSEGAPNDVELGFRFPTSRLAIMPGNHDRYLGRAMLPLSEQFESSKIFGTEWTVAPRGVKPWNPYIKSFKFKKDGETLHIIAVDFTYTRYNHPLLPWMYFGQGRVDRNVLAALTTVTESCRKSGAVVWAIHYPPNVTKESLVLVNQQLLADLALSLQIPCIFSGHTHKAKDAELGVAGSARPTRVICVGTPCAFDDEPKMFYEVHLPVKTKQVVSSQVKIKKMVKTRMVDDITLQTKERFVEEVW